MVASSTRDDLAGRAWWLDGPTPHWAVAVGALIAAGLGLRAAEVIGGGLLLAPVAAAFVAGIAWRGVGWDLALALGSCCAVARSGVEPLNLAAPWMPFLGQSEGQVPLLALRLGLLFVAVVRLRSRPVVLAALAALCVASLAASGLVVAWALGVPLVLRACVARTARKPTAWVPRVILLVALLGLLPHSSVPSARSPDALPVEVEYWRARKNLFRAHVAALAWARRETRPGEGHLALAEVDIDLGRKDPALKVLGKVSRGGATAGELERARELEARAAALP
jgi:hypothetical protein